jgi:2-oxoisovalerate dehydrogenase E1 component
MTFDRKDKDNATLLNLYLRLLYPRMVEEKMLILLRQGRIGKWFSGIGQEAIAVGSTLAMHNEEYILPMHRNLGVFTSRNIPLTKLMAQWQGKVTGFTKGRDRSFHFGTQEHRIIGMISHLGPQMALADGIALADLIGNKKQATLVFTGEGATSEGDFHEAINVAAVWNLPVIFLIENNGYGLSTPINEQFKCKDLVDKAIGYGIEGFQVDGNNILKVYDLIDQVATSMRENPKPVLIECLTFRMRGHEEASGTKYVPQELFEEWAAKDPVKNFEQYNRIHS